MKNSCMQQELRVLLKFKKSVKITVVVSIVYYAASFFQFQFVLEFSFSINETAVGRLYFFLKKLSHILHSL